MEHVQTECLQRKELGFHYSAIIWNKFSTCRSLFKQVKSIPLIATEICYLVSILLGFMQYNRNNTGYNYLIYSLFYHKLVWY